MPHAIANAVEVELEEAAELIEHARVALIAEDWIEVVRAAYFARVATDEAFNGLMKEVFRAAES